jgi:UDP-glucose 4-epimerase
MMRLKGLRILVTGGAGFIGSHLVDKLIEQGNQVTVYDNLSTGKEEFIRKHFSAMDFRFVNADMLDIDALMKSVNGHDIVFHLAANSDARQGNIKTRLDLEQNTIATYNLLESMRRNDVSKIVFTSSGTVYGSVPGVVLEENYGPILPISLYGASKVACECLISAFCDIFGMQSWIFRFGNIVGPRATHGVILDLINKLKANREVLEVLGDGGQTKPYVHMLDCIDGIVFGVENSHEKVNIYNLAVPTVTSVKRIVKLVLEKTGNQKTKVKYTGGEKGWPGDVPLVQLSIAKFAKLGWKAKYSSDEAVAMTIDSLLKQS